MTETKTKVPYDQEDAVFLSVLFRHADAPANAPANAEHLRARLNELVTATADEVNAVYTRFIGNVYDLEIDKETLAYMAASRSEPISDADLKAAVVKARNAQLLFNGQPVKNWGYGNGLVMVVDQKLELIGYFDESESELSPKAAVAKAVTSWFLDRFGPGQKGDITDPKNVEFLNSLGVKVGPAKGTAHVYAGAITPFNLNGQRFYVIGGHYYFNIDIRRELVKGADVDINDDNTMAGAAEMTLAHLTALNLTRGETELEGMLRYEFLDNIQQSRDPAIITILS